MSIFIYSFLCLIFFPRIEVQDKGSKSRSVCKKIPVKCNPKKESLQVKTCQNDEKKTAKIIPGATDRPYGLRPKKTAKIYDFRSCLLEKNDFL